MEIMGVKIDDVKLMEMFRLAVMAQMGEEVRERIITEAITKLTQPENSYGSDRRTPLQKLFDQTICDLATNIVQEVVTKNLAIHEKIAKVASEAVKQFIAKDDTELAQRLSLELGRLFCVQ